MFPMLFNYEFFWIILDYDIIKVQCPNKATSDIFLLFIHYHFFIHTIQYFQILCLSNII